MKTAFPLMLAAAGLALLAGCGKTDEAAVGVPGTAGADYCKANLLGAAAIADTAACAGCVVNGHAAAVDNDPRTFAVLTFIDAGGTIGLRAVAANGRSFPARAEAGALIRFPAGSAEEMSVRFNTYLAGQPVDRLLGGESASGALRPDQEVFYTVTPTRPFDALEAVVTVRGGETAAVRVHEFCAER
ncbi:MAG TPA: hypothetical protein VFV27_00200 [Nevskiaceae bacterium]|nr:hypothetical protein [Nevskiaceae bacterium]